MDNRSKYTWVINERHCALVFFNHWSETFPYKEISSYQYMQHEATPTAQFDKVEYHYTLTVRLKTGKELKGPITLEQYDKFEEAYTAWLSL
jgi:hypothetical protein